MKKICFSDKFALTAAVLSGRKTQTRRIIKGDVPLGNWSETYKHSKYKVGEEVAVAQSYKDAGVEFIPKEDKESNFSDFPAELTHGWTNKLYVRSDLMPNRIRITNVRVERLNEITDGDCLAEGIYKDKDSAHFNGYAFEVSIDQHGDTLAKKWYATPQEVYAALIDRISGKGTWESNPWCFVYDFELIK